MVDSHFYSFRFYIYVMNTEFKEAQTLKAFEDARILFKMYAVSLNIDLSFQDFTSELRNIHVQYSRPKGALLIAYIDGDAAGCVGVRELSDKIAELKRMFVRPEFRNFKIGVKLLSLILDISRELGYSKIRLDTLPDMVQAQKLYRSFGFSEIQSYRYNPIEGTVYMEREL